MDEREYKRLYLGEFAPTEKDRKLHEMAKEYHKETEAYDQTVCSGKNERGVAMPIDRYEYSLINKNALAVMRRLLDENKGITSQELHKAIIDYAGQQP